MSAAQGYRAAQQLIETGQWIVDFEAGRIVRADGREVGYWRFGRRFIGVVTETHRYPNLVFARVLAGARAGRPVPAGLEVDHRNGRKGDDRVVNLEEVTPEENLRRAIEMRREALRTEAAA